MDTPHTKLILVDPATELCERWEYEIGDEPDVAIVCGRFEDVAEYDCMVSAGNSFGLMDGGVDLAIVRHFGYELMDRVQATIIRDFRGEQPVGTSFVVETGSAEHPFLAHTPTMRVPMPIATTDHAYVAMFAMLLAVHRHNLDAHADADRRIESVACPGLGTGYGRMPFAEAARQMLQAVRNFRSPADLMSWPYAEARQRAIGRGGDHSGRT